MTTNTFIAVAKANGEVVSMGNFAAVNRDAALFRPYGGQVTVRRMTSSDAAAVRKYSACMTSAQSRAQAVREFKAACTSAQN